MSDDGYYASSGSDDMFFDADPDPDLAEDLAEHTAPSPVYYDTPGSELLNHHSDWEYYSDDFYDDDMTLSRIDLPHGLQNYTDKTRVATETSTKKNRKRKFAEIGEIPPIDLGERRTLLDCLKGTVWARPISQDGRVYHEGQQEKVALLKNWKDLYGNFRTNHKISRLKKSQRDESWANDLSLADMGLQNAQNHSLARATDGAEQEAFDEEEEEDYDDNEGEQEEAEEYEGAEADVDEPLINLDGAQPAVRVGNATKLVQNQHALANNAPTRDLTSTDAATRMEKRLRTSMPLSPPVTNQEDSLPLEEKSDADRQEIEGDTQKAHCLDIEDQDSKPSGRSRHADSKQNNKKRKASLELEEMNADSGLRMSTRAKRAASRRYEVEKTETSSDQPEFTKQRSTRAKKR